MKNIVKFFGLLCVLACMVFSSCEMEVAEKKPPAPADPNITQQPADVTIAKSDTLINVAPLAVRAANVPGTTPHYQWYENTTKSNEGGRLISGATSRTYTPPFTLDTPEGEYFFYVIVTMKDNDSGTVSGESVSVAVSYKIIIEPTADNTAAVDITKKYQYVRGFGGTMLIWSNHPDDLIEDYEKMYDPNGPLGYNIARIMIPPDSTDIDDTMDKLIRNEKFQHVDPTKGCRYGGNWWYEENNIPPPAPTAINPQGGKDNSDYYEIVKVVNKHGGYVFASPWSPPGDWKNNGTYRGSRATPGVSDHLLPEHYPDFANYLKRFAEKMYENGAPLYAVALQNEHTWAVDYEGCQYTQSQHQDFWTSQGHFMSKAIPRGPAPASAYKMPSNVIPGWGAGRALTSVLPMSAEAHNEIEGLNSVVENTSSGNIARKGYDILARHIYGATPPNSDKFLSEAQFHTTDPKEVWQTEWSSSGLPDNSPEQFLAYSWNYVWVLMNAIDYTIRLNNESAYVWFPSKAFDALLGSGGENTTLGDILPRGYAMSHFAKYAKETGRVGVTITGTNASAANPPDNRDITHTSAQWRSPKITAYVTLNDDFYEGPVESRHRRWRGVGDDSSGVVIDDLDVNNIKSISLVMYTPTNYTGGGGTDMGMIRIQLPEGFIIGETSAIRSSNNSYHQQANIIIGADGRSAFVELSAGRIVSVRLDKAQ